MESFHAVLRTILSRIQNLPIRIPSPEQVLPPTTRQTAYDVPPTRWGEETLAGVSRQSMASASRTAPGRHPRHSGRSSLPWRWSAEALGVTSFPAPRGLVTCQPMV